MSLSPSTCLSLAIQSGGPAPPTAVDFGPAHPFLSSQATGKDQESLGSYGRHSGRIGKKIVAEVQLGKGEEGALRDGGKNAIVDGAASLLLAIATQQQQEIGVVEECCPGKRLWAGTGGNCKQNKQNCKFLSPSPPPIPGLPCSILLTTPSSGGETRAEAEKESPPLSGTRLEKIHISAIQISEKRVTS